MEGVPVLGSQLFVPSLILLPETGGMADEPDVSADTISNLSPSTQIERNDGSEALDTRLQSHASDVR